MKALTERQKLILALVIREYVDSTQPVGSMKLVESYNLDFSSATVRNEMASPLHLWMEHADDQRLLLVRPTQWYRLRSAR